MKNKTTLMNTISNLILQVLTIASGFIIPRIILGYFGSNTNGLVSSINQILGYISLLEGGVTSVIMAKLYKPLYDKDNEKLSSIIVTAKKFYKNIGYVFIGYILVVAAVYPVIFKSTYSYTFIFTLTMILSINMLVQYLFSLTYKTLLNADKKIYIVSITQSIIIIINILLAVGSVKIWPNIHLFKALTGITYLIQPLIYNCYVKRNYNLNLKAKENKNLLKNRWSGFSINLAAFIHNSTDVVILTIFTDLATVSIYSVYALVTNGLKQVITAVTSAITPVIGREYASKNIDSLNNKMDLFEYITLVITSLLFSVGILLIVPFVMLYTKNINDANYYQPIFGILIMLSEYLYLIKSPHLNLSYVADKFKEITPYCYGEAAINIIISLILVSKYKLVGVAIGTICAMLFRLIYQVIYTRKIIVGRKPIVYFGKMFVFILVSIIGILMCNQYLPVLNYSIIGWIIHAVLYTIIFVILYFAISCIFFKKDIKELKKYLFNK